MFKWNKKHKIFRPQKKSWLYEYAQCPTTLFFDDFIRVYFSCRPQRKLDGSCTSQSAFIDIDRHNFAILSISERPILDLGGTGEFDQFGSMAGTVLSYKNQYYLYYCGWTRMHSVPYNWAIGLALSRDGKNFTRYGTGPIVGPTYNEPYLQACPVVKIINDTWHMWYLSGLRWVKCNDSIESIYQIMHATSNDGISWKRTGEPILPEVFKNECQTSATIIEHSGEFHMWFSFRHGVDFRNSERGYRIGYACSDDLINWHREDSLAGINVSSTGWDSEMVCYPHVFQCNDKIVMLYCGNYFGRDGFGYAELEK